MKVKASKYVSSLGQYFKHNRQFCAYVILSLIIATVVRIYTVGEVWVIQPFLIDLSLIVILGSFAYLYTPQKQFGYLFILMLFFTTMGVMNAIYFSFFNSFASISMLSAVVQVGDVSEAVFEGLRITHFVYILAPIIFYLYHRRLKNKDYFNFIVY